MKKIIYAFACATLLGITSCDSFLEVDPKDSITSGAYYKTEQQAVANINKLYRQGAPERYANAGSAYLGPKATLPGILTGYFTNGYEGQEIICLYSRLLTRQQYPSNLAGAMNDIWDPCYKAVNIANGAIKYFPGIEMDENNKAKYIAEAKFFRGFNYYYLVKTFGDVPLTEEPYETVEDFGRLYPERTSASTVYALIESDLKAAVETLPAATFVANGHRISKYTAAMLLSTVYFQQGKYAEAATYAKMVIESPHSLTANTDMAMNSAFNKLRSLDDLDEVVYAVEFDEAIKDGGWWPTYSFNASATAVFDKYSIFQRVYGPTNRYLNVYKADDLRIQPYQFFHWEYTNPVNNKTWKAEDSAGCWYYFDENAMLNSGKATKDWNIFRFAEALLVGAEAIAQSTGVNAEAAGYLAQIKARADMNGKTVAQYTTELQTLSKEAFIEECWTERLREFPLEFKIWDDCIRTGKFPVISETEKGGISYVTLVGATNGAGAVFKESDLLWSISIDELQRNPSLKQNTGY